MSNNQSLEKIKRAVTYIEDNIQERILLDDIAVYTRLSKYHLHRIFRAITKQRLMDYVRGRKLSLSINELLNTDLKLIDIAYEYGFDYEQSYIRSFTRLFKVSPSKFRLEGNPVQITDKINVDCIRSIGTSGVVLEPTIWIMPQFTVVGIERKINHKEPDVCKQLNQYANDFYSIHRESIRNAKNPNIHNIIVTYMENDPDITYFMTALEVSDDRETPNGMKRSDYPAQKYVVFKYIGFHDAKDTTMDSMHELYSFICQDWFPNSGYKFAKLYHVEKYDTSKSRKDYCEVDLLFPVESKF